MASNEEAEQPWLSLRNIRVVRRGKTLLDCAEFDIRRRELHILTGKQGGGKTTLCNILCGEQERASGKILVDGAEARNYNTASARRLGVERVSAFPHVFPHLTVWENISISLNRFPNPGWFGRRSLIQKVEAWLGENNIPGLPLESLLEKTPQSDHLFFQALASLFSRPRLLILDETLENLPVNRLEQVMAILRREMAEGMSVLWATHQLEDGWRLADRLTILRHGKILLTDLPGNIDRRSLLRLAYAQFPETEEDEKDRERFHNLILYTEALLKDLPLAIVIVDSHGMVQFINRAGRAMLPGLGLESYGSESFFAVFRNGNANIGKAVTRVLGGEERQSLDSIPFISQEGEKRVDCQVQVVRDGFVTIGAMLIMQDVSERERLRNRLILSHNVSSVGLLASGVAHDVNNPLSAIGNYLSYLMRKLPDGELKNAASRIDDEARTIQRIIDNLIAFSGHARHERDCVDLHALTLELCALLRFNAERSHIRVEVTPPPEGEATLLADVKEMRQLLLNLLRNAMEAMPDGGGVFVDFSACAGDRLELKIADTGPGIGLERLEDIFEPFVSTKSEDDRYHGIGLTIVYSIVEKYGGSIEVANRTGGGCEFTLRFPVGLRDGALSDAGSR